MKIAVIAADGRLGRAFVTEARAHGHEVRAGARTATKGFIACDATDPEQVKNLIQGCEVVVSCIGHIKGSADDMQTTATHVIVQAMDELGITRFVDLTGTGARFPGDKVALVDRFLNLGVRLVDPHRIKDGIAHMEVLQASDLAWTTIRVLKLQNVAAQPFTLLLSGPTKLFVGRQEAAQAMLQVIEQTSFVKQSPIIGKKV